jgi:spore maturation protein CgeB
LNVRVLVLDTYYSAFWRAHYRERPGLADRGYVEQFRSLTSTLFGTAGVYSHHLRELGHDAEEVIVNCLPLQAAWARENGVAPLARLATAAPGVSQLAARALLPRVVTAQVEAFDPDIVYAQDVRSLWGGVRRRVGQRGCLLVAQIASTAPPDDVLHDCDLVITSFPHWVTRLRARGIGCEYLPLAFDERVLSVIEPDDERRYPVSFVGTLRPTDYRRGAQSALERACADLDVSVWGTGAAALPPESPILGDYRGEAWGRDMYRVLAASRIALNRHNDLAEGHANNMRLYEATGMGSVLVTEDAPNLRDLFEPGREVVVYKDPEDLVTKVRHLLENDGERRRIADAGQRRTLSHHTYEQRMPQIAELLDSRLS